MSRVDRAGFADLAEVFASRFEAAPRFFQAPGRINVIGEHTDYCDGLVMPAAIDRWCRVAAAPNGTRRLRLFARDKDENADLDLDRLAPRGGWPDYVAGVAHILNVAGTKVPGADLVFDSTVPIGAGVSSSAALEVAIAHALLALGEGAADGTQIARWAQRAENEFVGMPCGIMDQFASANGVQGSALLLDCRDLSVEILALPREAAFLIVNSMVRHAHVGGEYARRREDCETAARLLGVAALRDVSPEALERGQNVLPPLPARRARHVVGEIVRVREAAAAMRAGDIAQLGRLMSQSHESLARDMEVSIPELDTLAGIARGQPGVHGARMMGGGFGGCIIALASRDSASAALQAIREDYGRVIGAAPDAFIAEVVAGAGEVTS